RIPDLN
ncbi:hypothetical protein CP082626L3_1562, partial [Chlamydia psittaci 08-2626_L3]